MPFSQRDAAIAYAIAELTKTDTRALWHAVEALAMQVRVMPGMRDDWPEGLIDAERATLTAARRALRKVRAIQKTASGA